MKDENELLDRTLRPMMLISMAMGMSFPRPILENRSRLVFFYRILVLSTIVLLMINEIPTMTYWTSKSEGIHGILAFFETRLRWFSLIFNFILSGFANSKINEIIWTLKTTPLILRQNDHKKIIIFQLFVLLITLTFLIPYMCLGLDFLWLNPYYSWYTSSVYIITEFYIAFPHLQFIVFLFVIKNYFKRLNSTIRNYNAKSSVSSKKADALPFFVVDIYGGHMVDDIVECRRIHMELIESCMKTNECFTLQILLFLVMSIIEITYSFRSAITFLINPNSENVNFWRSKFALEASLTFFWSTYYFSNILNIIANCETLVQESVNTNAAVNLIINQMENKEIKKQLRVFSLQLSSQKVFFTAGKFVELTYPLINSIVGTVTTYLIIITTIK